MLQDLHRHHTFRYTTPSNIAPFLHVHHDERHIVLLRLAVRER
jgi:hypothetical protein